MEQVYKKSMILGLHPNCTTIIYKLTNLSIQMPIVRTMMILR